MAPAGRGRSASSTTRAWQLSMGRPSGMWSPSSPRTRWKTMPMAVSEGPYPLLISRPGTISRSRWTACGTISSPPTTRCRSEETLRTAAGSDSSRATSMPRIAGTKSVTVTRWRSMASTVRSRSRNSPCSGTTVRPPVVSGHSSCQMAESKVWRLFWSTTSRPVARKWRVMKRNRLASPPCRLRAHLGVPVVPEVNTP
ncbi:hypothetical protein LUW77_30155 [Streptomyces radiopugnans]|nr:hypothetical protein LUW77_30155 [Streptomyces radiopugnans]